jgi:hypothetical protein
MATRPSASREWLKNLGAVAIFLHFGVLALNALPRSRLVDTLYPFYGFYPTYTGQTQAWSMYVSPDRHATDYDLQVRFDDAGWQRPWGTSREMSARQVYFLESLFGSDEGQTTRFFEALRARYPKVRRPVEVRLRRTSRDVNAYSEVPSRGVFANAPQTQDLSRAW